MASLQLNLKPFKILNPFIYISSSCTPIWGKVHYNITLLPGDGIGPESVSVAKQVLNLTASLEGIEFKYQEMPVGGVALDLTGVPLPEETLSVAKQSDAILLGAIGGYKWDANEKHLKPETGLLQLREGLGVFANLRPATVLPQLIDSSTLKREVAKGVDLMVVRELAGGIYFGKPRFFGKNENGDEIGFNTLVCATKQMYLRVVFKILQLNFGKYVTENLLELRYYSDSIDPVSNSDNIYSERQGRLEMYYQPIIRSPKINQYASGVLTYVDQTTASVERIGGASYEYGRKHKITIAIEVCPYLCILSCSQLNDFKDIDFKYIGAVSL
ncbi:hypothetical protein MKX01_020831 [Papaver californicum]|nr:hypothetical protein MKX01_020831 [Papaver californicum]